MINPETVSESFVKWMESNSFGTFETDLFLSQVPITAPDTCYWVVTSGGDVIQKLKTGERIQQYFVEVHYRSNKSETIERNLFTLTDKLNCSDCVGLEGFEVIEMSANQFPTDDDLDAEDRRVGFVQAQINIYKKEC